MSKTIQVRVTEHEHAYIKNALKDDNISQLVRDFLLSQAQERMDSDDMSLQDADPTVQSFLEVLSSPHFQRMLYNIFREVHDNESV